MARLKARLIQSGLDVLINLIQKLLWVSDKIKCIVNKSK